MSNALYSSTTVISGSASTLVFVFFLAIILLLVVILGVVLYRQRFTLLPEKAKEAIVKAEEEAQAIIAQAHAEARRVRLDIEKERVKALSDDRSGIERFLDAYQFRLEKMIKELSYGLEKEHMRATTHFVEVLQTIEQRVALNADEAKHSMSAFTDQSSKLFERLAFEIENVEKGIQHLALALEEAAANESGKNTEIVREEMRKIGEQTAQAVVDVAKGLDEVLRINIEKEFGKITTELNKYREARMKLINERMLILVEETAQIALQKQLSLQDQADLVYRALEEAKQKGVFV